MINKFLVLTCTSLLLATAVSAKAMPRKNEKKLYIGSNATEATMTFTGNVKFESSKKPTPTVMREFVESQVEHTIGPMSVATFTAVPKGDHVLSDVKVISQVGNLVTVSYKYKGTIVLQKNPKERSLKTTYDIVLPINPSTIYEASMVGDHNPCTDEHYQSEGDFWYFWNPKNPGCKLVKDKDFTIVKANILRFANTKISYPEYHNLPDKNGKVSVHILFGMDSPTESRNALSSSDINASNYRDFRDYLISQGFSSREWTATQIKTIAKTVNGALPFVETFEKGNISYRFFFGPSGIDEESLAFHWFFKDAIENASIMDYSGHSGLGGHLDLGSIEESLQTPIHFNKERYQIFFFDSCTSYKYYNQAFFERKISPLDPKGTKKLDVFTNGLATYFDAMPNANRRLALAIDKALNYSQSETPVYVSYQTLVKQIDSENLFSISGDEDNDAPKKTK